MADITIRVEAPELVKAMETLAAALTAQAEGIFGIGQLGAKQILSAAAQAVDNGQAPTEEPPKTKTEAKAEAPDTNTAAQDTEPDNDTADSSDSSDISLETVRAKLTQLGRAGKSAKVKELLKDFGASKISEVKESDYEALLAKAEKIA